MRITTEKDFDCVKTVRKERERIAKDTEGKSPKEVLEYFRKRKKMKLSK
jgi:hypothetical protein